MSRWNDDLSLIEECRSGRLAAYGELVERYQERLFAVVARLTGSAEDAADVVQNAFIMAFQKLDRFQGKSSFYTWVYRIAINLAKSSRRKKKRERRMLEADHHGGTEPPDERPDGDPSFLLEQAERDRQVQDALNGLAADHRAVIVLKDIDGLRYEEIAEILDVPVGTVRSRLHRARSELRERLRGVMEEAPVR